MVRTACTVYGTIVGSPANHIFDLIAQDAAASARPEEVYGKLRPNEIKETYGVGHCCRTEYEDFYNPPDS